MNKQDSPMSSPLVLAQPYSYFIHRAENKQRKEKIIGQTIMERPVHMGCFINDL